MASLPPLFPGIPRGALFLGASPFASVRWNLYYLPTHPFFHPPFIRPSIHPSIKPSISVYLSIHPSITVYLSIHLYPDILIPKYITISV